MDLKLTSKAHTARLAQPNIDHAVFEIADRLAHHVSPVFADASVLHALGVHQVVVYSHITWSGRPCYGLYSLNDHVVRLSANSLLPASTAMTAEVLRHEYGHGIERNYQALASQHLEKSPERRRYVKWSAQWRDVLAKEGPPTAYSPAASDIDETKAEAFQCYLEDPEGFKRRSPSYAALCEEAFTALMPGFIERYELYQRIEQGLSLDAKYNRRRSMWITTLQRVKGGYTSR